MVAAKIAQKERDAGMDLDTLRVCFFTSCTWAVLFFFMLAVKRCMLLCVSTAGFTPSAAAIFGTFVFCCAGQAYPPLTNLLGDSVEQHS